MKQSIAGNHAISGNVQAARGKRLALTPLTGAVRSVLAISGTLLALSGSGAAFAAGSCFELAPNTVACNGDFTTTLPGTLFAPVVDMTLVLGDSAPTSVIPGAGQVGVDASWGGNVGVISFADITTSGATAVHLAGTTSATIDNQGGITTDVTADGAFALDVHAGGNVAISNAGDILAHGTGIHDVTAVNAYSADADVLFDNLATGTITAQAQDGNAIAVLSFADGSGIFSNAGSISAGSVNGVAIGVLNQAYSGDATLANTGTISADAGYYQAIAVLASSNAGMASVDNAGVVRVFGGEDQSFAIMASGQTGSTITNGGTIAVDTSMGSATGAWASTQDGAATVTNSLDGYISGYTAGSGDLVAMRADSTNGTAAVDNQGRISLIARVGASRAVGMEAYSGAGSTIHNNGYVLAGSYSSATAGAIAIAEGGDAAIVNDVSGYVRSVTIAFVPEATSRGLLAQALDGDASIVNLGSVVAASNGGNTSGVLVRAAGGDASGDNHGSIRASALSYSDVLGLSVNSTTGLSTVVNSGSIRAESQMLLGRFTDQNNIRGIEAFSYNGTTVENTGDITAKGAWFVRGVVAAATLGDVHVSNAQGATISAMGLNGYGILAEAQNGAFAATVDNAGTIDIIQTGNCYCNGVQPVGVGIKINSLYAEGIVANNTGEINVISQHSSYGIWGTAYFGDAVGDNSGEITLFSSGYSSSNAGMFVRSHYSNASLTNSGDITIQMAQENTANFNVDNARGMWGSTGTPHYAVYNGGPRPDGGGDLFMENSGTIAILDAQTAYGMVGDSHYQRAELVNSGDITAVSDRLHGVATGMFASAFNTRYAHDYAYHSPNGNAIIENTGSIWLQAQETARGIRTFSQDDAGAQVTNSGDVTAMASGGGAYGVVMVSFNYPEETAKDLAVDNSGTINAINHAGTNEDDYRGGVKALGILVNSFTNSIVVDNSGDVVVESTAGTCDSSAFAYACFSGATVGSAVGILASSGHGHYHGYYSGDINVVNTGNISASVHSSSSTQMKRYGAYYGYGAFAAGILTVGDYGNVDSTNAGIINVSAKGEGYTPEGQTLTGWATTAAGMMGSTFGSLDAEVGTIVLTNTGSISVSAEAVYADGTALAVGMGAQHDTFIGDQYNDGRSNGHGTISVNNYGSINVAATVSGAGTGTPTGNGISAVSSATFGEVSVRNQGAVQSVATGPLLVRSNGVLVSGARVDVRLGEGSVVVTRATGATGSAIGLSVSGDAVTASNAGILQAEFVGGGNTFGARLASTADSLSFANSGTIMAIGADNAIGVQLNNATATTLINSGTIAAMSDGAGSSAVRTGASADLVLNSGTISGAVDSGAGDDTFSNLATGTWVARATSSFGAGDDNIGNAGTIHLDNAIIDLGTSTTTGNRFDNTGHIVVWGNNTIDMGAANQNAFLNNGTIEFRNGVVGDTLHIVGNLGGSAVAPGNPRGLHAGTSFMPSSGSINFDVSGANGTADLLYVDGNVLAGTYNTVNINLLDLPTTAFSNIALIYVAGDSTSGSFRLGQVNYDPNGSFMTLAFNLVAQIDASNATPDVFSLGAGAGHVGRGGGGLGSGRDVAPQTGAGGAGGHDLGGGRDLAGAGGNANGNGTGGGNGGYVGGPTPGNPGGNGSNSPGTSTSPIQTILSPRNLLTRPTFSSNVAGLAPQPAGLELTGLSDSGTMAASLAPGVQSLLGSEIGTWRQRLGIVDEFRKGSVALWARLFQDSGKISPDHGAGNFGQGGNFDFDQRNSGLEVGADFAITEAFSAGLLVGKSDARQSLQQTGAGVSRIDGDTFGGYATWISDGFYVDAAYRHMSFDARLNTSSGELRTSGDADAFSIEGGYAWTVGNGFKIEPQLQYTRISVDDLGSMQGTLATFHSTGGVSSRGRAGVMGRKDFAAGSAVWTPYVSLNVVREFDGDNGFNVNNTFFGETSTKGTSALVEGGLNVQIGKFSVFGGVNWQDGGALDSIVGGQLGARYAW